MIYIRKVFINAIGFFIAFNFSCHATRVNFNTIKSDFILETKRINIPGYRYVFNPSIIRWGDSFLMSFRVQNKIYNSAKAIGLVWLDKDFNAKGKPYILEIRDQKENNFFVRKNSNVTEQDPRLIKIKDRLYMVYNNLRIGRMFIAELYYDGHSMFLNKPECLLNFEGSNRRCIEKNWVPFQYEDKLLLAYSISPHKILLPLLGTESCETYACSKKRITWDWGEIRGGTPAFMVEGKYLSFFHSSKYNIKSNYSEGINTHHYFMGAYMFDPHPPFEITHISPYPIICDDFYNGKSYNKKGIVPLKVVFPMGFVFDDDYIWISYGKQDHECWIAKLDKKRLLKSLVPLEKR
jgi:predicted GH43/DUF377 family glycosyl hydrolase